ncbi:MAG TPA: DNA polymerase IV, partial [Sporichthya sp.]|nr:DNA polymerase IV [Sporichthya sp.]
GLLGQAHGKLLARLSHGEDDRPVSPHRESKSVSVEDTFERDVVERAVLTEICDRMSATVSKRLRGASLSGRTITVKIRRHDFQSHTRSSTLPGPTDDARTISTTARRLLAEIDTTDGIRLLGVGVSGLVDWAQEDLFAEEPTESEEPEPEPVEPTARRWFPGQDVQHAEHGAGWVQGSGVGRVTVRFETRYTPPGRIRTFAIDDPDLAERPAVLPENGVAEAD